MMAVTKVRDDARLTRMITLAFLLSTRTEIHIDELIERLGVNRKQIEADLNVLMFCGLPPYSPEQLFDIVIDEDFVSMYFNNVFIAPLRLDTDEKAHVLVALARLEAQSDTETKERIKEVASVIDNRSDRVVVEVSPSQHDLVIHQAIEHKKAMGITYLSMSSASITQRTIDPLVVYTTASISYVFAYDHHAKATRIFRSDRILGACVLDEDQSEEKQLAEDLLADSSEYLFVENKENYVDLLIGEETLWIIDTYPNECVDTEASKYRFYSPTAFFAARILTLYAKSVQLAGGTFSRDTIVGAIKTIRAQMLSTYEKREKNEEM